MRSRLLSVQQNIAFFERVLPKKDDSTLSRDQRQTLRAEHAFLRKEHLDSQSPLSFPTWYAMQKAGLAKNIEQTVENLLHTIENAGHSVLRVSITEVSEALNSGDLRDPFLVEFVTFNNRTGFFNRASTVGANGVYTAHLKLRDDTNTFETQLCFEKQYSTQVHGKVTKRTDRLDDHIADQTAKIRERLFGSADTEN